MATEVAVVIVTVMPTWPVIEPRIIWTVHWSVIAITVIRISVPVVMTVMVINAA
jgi:hypothetical protein